VYIVIHMYMFFNIYVSVSMYLNTYMNVHIFDDFNEVCFTHIFVVYVHSCHNRNTGRENT